MVEIPIKTERAWDKDTLIQINALRPGKVYSAQNLQKLQRRPETPKKRTEDISGSPGRSSEGRETADRVVGEASCAPPLQMKIPLLEYRMQKGQKVLLPSSVRRVNVCIGWNSTNSICDVDVSAFLLGDNGRVIGDDWFVFYGQTKSPDGSTFFEMNGNTDREVICVDFEKLNPSVRKIVFVLTIHEAFQKKLNFGMLKDAYIRILNRDDQKELVSFQMTDYYENVISMMIGELYLHNGNWKFHGIGNGAAKDLAGLCGLYGVQVSD